MVTLADGRPVGVGSEFTGRTTARTRMPASLAPSLGEQDTVWSPAGPPAADRLARAVHEGRELRHLDVPQLLERVLGLAIGCGTPSCGG